MPPGFQFKTTERDLTERWRRTATKGREHIFFVVLDTVVDDVEEVAVRLDVLCYLQQLWLLQFKALQRILVE